MTTSSGSITIADGTSTKIILQTKLWFPNATDEAPNAPTVPVTTDPATPYGAWNITKPNYNASYPYYFTCIQYKYKDNTYDWSVVELDVSDRIKKIWSDINGSYIASGINSATAVDINNTATWGFNSKLTPTSLAFNYNAGGTTSGNATFLDIGAANGLRIYDYQYNNGTYTGGTTRVQLTNAALSFFKPDGSNAASVSSAGLVLTSGGITAGTASSSGFVYLSTDNYGNYSINGSSGISDWKQIIGTKFGVRADGTLYASNANISGTITIGSGSNVYTKTEADETFDASGEAAAAQAAAIAAAATDATNKADAAQAAAIAEIPTNISELTNDSGYQTSSEVSSAISNIQIGGRNLLLTTDTMETWESGSACDIEDGVATLHGTANSWNAVLYTNKYDINLYDGVTPYIWSFEYKSLSDCLITCVISASSDSIDSASWTRTKYTNWQSQFTLPSSGGDWKKYTLNSRTISQSDLSSGSGTMTSGFLQIYARTNSVDVDLRHIQLEKGNKATDWSVAPEDVDTIIENNYESLDYRCDNIQSDVDTKDSFGLQGYIIAANGSLGLYSTTVGAPQNSVNISSTGILLNYDGNPIAQLTSITDEKGMSFLKVDKEYVSQIFMRDSSGNGTLGWVAQSNGHLTLKVVR